ncbi:unnamed protein product [Lactuca saligna]|uniref:Uncharacterized protein n=1 Tax=Lactuca saligna TaxID=75948 RepID=A0AA35UP42_LACSI|nr:unnamed protein product [Lactuca saligna]
MEMPFLSGFTTTRPKSDSSRDSEHPDHESTNNLHHQGSSLDRIVLINPVTQGMVVIGGGATRFRILDERSDEEGRPATNASNVDQRHADCGDKSRQWKPAPTFLFEIMNDGDDELWYKEDC